MKAKATLRIDSKMGKFRTIWGLMLPPEKKFFGLILTLTVILPVIEILGIGGIFGFIDLVIEPEKIDSYEWLVWARDVVDFDDNVSFITFIGFCAIASLTIRNAFIAVHLWLKTKFGLHLSAALAGRLLNTYLHSPYQFFVSNNSSILLKNVNSESQLLSTSYIIPILTILSSIFVFAFIVGGLILYDPLITLSALGMLGFLYGIIYLLVRNKLMFLGTRRYELNSDRFEFTNQALCGIQDIKVLGCEQYFLNRSVGIFHKLADLSVLNAVLSKTPRLALEVFVFGGLVAVVIFAVLTEREIVQDISTIALYGLATYRLMPYLDSFLNAFNTLRFNNAAVEMIQDHLSMATEQPRQSDGEVTQLPFKKEIRFSDVSFLYDTGSSHVIKGLDFTIDHNTSVGFVGPSGVGKSTVVNMVLGLLSPTQGEISVDGTLISDDTKRRWQKNIGFVPQDIYLSDDSVVGNIAFGIPKGEIDRDRVVEVASLAQIHEFIETQLNDGYETFIGERGIRLSGGQKQRIGIARALYHDPELLIFDEATSALDKITENIVNETINNISTSKTIIVIAHRFSTVRNCDKIYMLNSGRVEDAGSYEELMSRNKTFRQMNDIDQAANT